MAILLIQPILLLLLIMTIAYYKNKWKLLLAIPIYLFARGLSILAVLALNFLVFSRVDNMFDIIADSNGLFALLSIFILITDFILLTYCPLKGSTSRLFPEMLTHAGISFLVSTASISLCYIAIFYHLVNLV